MFTVSLSIEIDAATPEDAARAFRDTITHAKEMSLFFDVREIGSNAKHSLCLPAETEDEANV